MRKMNQFGPAVSNADLRIEDVLSPDADWSKIRVSLITVLSAANTSRWA